MVNKTMVNKTKSYAAKNWFKDLLKKPENIYLTVALFAVTVFVFITPPFQGPDEEAHYIRVQYIAHGRFIPAQDIDIPRSIEDVTKVTFYNNNIRGKTNTTYRSGNIIDALKIPLGSKGLYSPPMITYNPLLYLPAIPGTIAANLFNASAVVSLYIARLSIALVSIIIIFFSIKLLPLKKYLAVVVGLIPMMLFQQSVVSADSISYALLFLFISYILHLREKKQVTRNQWLIVGLLSVLIVLAKPLVFIFLPIAFILVKSKKTLALIIGIFVVCTAAYFAAGSLNSLPVAHADKPVIVYGLPNEVNGDAQLNNLIDHPRRGLRVAWNSYMTSYGDDEVRGVIGVFGAADTIYPLWMVIGYTIIISALFFISLDGKKVKPVRLRWKVFVLLLSATYFGAVNLALYLGYTPVNFDIVYGVQGRYFLPMIIAVSLVVATGGVTLSKQDSRKTIIWTMVATTVFVLLALFITFQRYYLYTP